MTKALSRESKEDARLFALVVRNVAGCENVRTPSGGMRPETALETKEWSTIISSCGKESFPKKLTFRV
jgi:hypothetical protein